jgi:hypothetical protein
MATHIGGIIAINKLFARIMSQKRIFFRNFAGSINKNKNKKQIIWQ